MHDVGLAFNAELAGFLDTGFRLVLQEVFGAHYLGADETTLEVGVDGTSSDRSGVANMDGPCTGFVRPGGEERM